MDKQFNDIELFNLCKKGDKISFEKLYSGYISSMLSYASARLESVNEAEDLIHDLFVHLWENRETIDIKHSVKAYLYSALNRKILNLYRKNNYKDLYGEYLNRMGEQFFFGPDAYIEEKEVKKIITYAVEAMPPRVREIFLLSREKQLSNREIAEKLSLSEQTVKNQLSSALVILRKVLNRAMLLIIFFYTI